MRVPAWLIPTLLCFAVAGGTGRADSPERRAIDPAKSTARFSVTHVWVERVTGTVPIASGWAEFAPGSAIPSKVEAVLDATKIATDDPDRNASLESPDFFDAQKFPTWTFTSTRIAAQGANAFEMDGDLTIHGVTQPERLTVTVGGDAAHPQYHVTGQIDRHAFGMAITRLDPTIGTTVDVTLDVALK